MRASTVLRLSSVSSLPGESTYRNVAQNCSAYCIKHDCKCTNKSGDEDVSCTTCKHFSDQEYCKLDLFDPIVAEHNF